MFLSGVGIPIQNIRWEHFYFISTQWDISKQKQADLKLQFIKDFGSEEAIKFYWLNNGRRFINKDMQAKYSISFYYFKKIIMTFPWFREKTKEEVQRNLMRATQATNLQRYGVKCNWASKDPKLNGRATMLEKYGVDRNSKTKEWKEQVKATWDSKTDAEKDAVINKILTTKHNARHLTSKYKFGDQSFDSFPELAFYIYMCLHTNSSIKRETKKFKYIYNNKTYTYIPDFEIDGQLYELKAKYWLKDWNVLGTKDNAKYQCMLNNNVKVLWEEDYKVYIDWFIEHDWDKEMFTDAGIAKRSATAALTDLLIE